MTMKRGEHAAIPGLENTVREVLGFFVAKGFFQIGGVAPKPLAKLDIALVLEVGRRYDRRLLEALPAAIIHFPRTFTNHAALSLAMQAAIKELSRGKSTGPAADGIPYDAMMGWLRRPLTDKRVRPVSARRVMKSFRFRPEVLQRLKTQAKESGLTETEFIERILSEAA